MSRLDTMITEYAKSCFGDINVEKDERFKQQIKGLFLELIGEIPSDYYKTGYSNVSVARYQALERLQKEVNDL